MDDGTTTDRFWIAPDGTLHRVGERFAARLGYGPGELDGQPLKRLLGRWAPEECTVTALAALLADPTPRPFLDLNGREVSLSAEVEAASAADRPASVRVTVRVPVHKSPARSAPPPSTAAAASAEKPPRPTEAPREAPALRETLADLVLRFGHDFRTPLNGLLGALGLLGDSPLTAPQKEWLHLLRRSAEELSDAVQDVLAAARAERGRPAAADEAFPLHGLLDAVAAPLEAAAREKNAAWSLEKPSDNPLVRADRDGLRRALVALGAAALQAVEHTRLSLRATTRAEGEGGLALRVELSSESVSADEGRRRWVRAVESLESPDAETGGRLAAARRAIARWGGSVTARAAEAPSVLLRVDVPMVRADAPAAAPFAVGSAAARPPRRHYRVLLVDDNPINQKIAQLQLEKLGYRAELAANGREALERLKARPVDLVWMDCQMPEMDGWTAAQEIRRLEDKNHRTPIVAVTANASESDRDRCRAAGMDEVVVKPVSLEAAARLLSHWDAPLNRDVLAALRDLSPSEFPKLREDFLRQTREEITALRTAVVGEDAAAAKAAAHKTKGTAGTFGAVRLQRLARWVEAAKKEEALDLVDALEEEWAYVAWTLGAGG